MQAEALLAFGIAYCKVQAELQQVPRLLPQALRGVHAAAFDTSTNAVRK
jgi:hypothetical protein